MSRRKVKLKGIPKQYHDLARQGLMYRYHGFWLGENERDRIVAEWLREQTNAAEIIKEMIYNRALGAIQGAPSVAGLPRDGDDEDEIGALGSFLLDFPT